MNKRIDFLLSKNKDLNYETILSLSKLDPTKEFKYLSWVVNRYKKDNILDSDLIIIKELLTSFNENKKLFPVEKKDINYFKTVLQLSSFLFDFEKNKKIDEQKFLENGSIKVYEDNKFLLIKPLTKESSIKFGKTTTWCTASLCNNSFYSYLSSGDLFILINKLKKESDAEKKIQFYFSYTGYNLEVRNSLNKSVDLVSILSKNKNIFNSLLKYDSVQNALNRNSDLFIFIENPTKEQIVKAIEADSKNFNLLNRNQILCPSIQIAYFESFLTENKNDSAKELLKALKNISKLTTVSHEVIMKSIETQPETAIFIQNQLRPLNEIEQKFTIEQDSSIIYDIKNPYTKVINYALIYEPEYILNLKKPTMKQIEISSKEAYGLLNKIISKFNLDPKKYIKIIAKISYYDEIVFKKYHKLLSYYHLKNIIKHNPDYIKYIKNPKENIQEIAIKHDYLSFNLIKNPSDYIKSFYEKEKEEMEKVKDKILTKKFVEKTYEYYENYAKYNSDSKNKDIFKIIGDYFYYFD